MVCLVFSKTEPMHNRRGNWGNAGESLKVADIQNLSASLNLSVFSCLAKPIAGVNHLLTRRASIMVYFSLVAKLDSSSTTEIKFVTSWFRKSFCHKFPVLSQLIFLQLVFFPLKYAKNII